MWTSSARSTQQVNVDVDLNKLQARLGFGDISRAIGDREPHHVGHHRRGRAEARQLRVTDRVRTGRDIANPD
jgi:hypothetical protein